MWTTYNNECAAFLAVWTEPPAWSCLHGIGCGERKLTSTPIPCSKPVRELVINYVEYDSNLLKSNHIP